MENTYPIDPKQREELSNLTIEQLADAHDNIIECFVRLLQHKAWKRKRKSGHFCYDPDGLIDVLTETLTLDEMALQLNCFLITYFDSLERDAKEEDKLKQE